MRHRHHDDDPPGHEYDAAGYDRHLEPPPDDDPAYAGRFRCPCGNVRHPERRFCDACQAQADVATGTRKVCPCCPGPKAIIRRQDACCGSCRAAGRHRQRTVAGGA